MNAEINKPIDILIADRNPRVRNYLMREMASAGHRVRLAENGRQVLFWIDHQNAPDIVIVDPDFPDEERTGLLTALARRAARLPVVIHSRENSDIFSPLAERAWFVRKQGDSIEKLKHVVTGIVNQMENGFTADIGAP